MTTIKNYVKMGLFVAAFMFLGVPAISHAAVYAYVDNGGYVKAVVANDWMTAIAVAPNIYIHSGVLLLNSASDSIVGNNVRGF